MRLHRKSVSIVLVLLFSCAAAFAGEQKPPKLTEESRKTLLRALAAEAVFVRRTFPMGKIGLHIEDGVVSPSEAEVRQLVADMGPAAKAGDRARITSLIFKGKAIIFEINGGPVKKKKWYDRVSVGSAGGTATPTNPTDKDPDNLYINARGSYVMLTFKDYVPDLTSEQVKQMLSPVLDFNAKSQAEAFAKTLSPQLQQALKDHKALVGMDRELVTYAKGRAPRKHRENENNVDYEEWIYGEPPNEVEFIRFKGDEVVRIEIMQVDGEKVVRTNKEIDLSKDVSSMAKKEDKESPKPEEKGPSLMRSGEKPLDVKSTTAAPSAPPRSTNPPDQQRGPGLPDASQGPPGLDRPMDGPPR